jgi:hypothetical protein
LRAGACAVILRGMNKVKEFLFVLGLSLVAVAFADAQEGKSFTLRGSNPDGKAYSGRVELQAQGDGVAVRWITGQAGDVTTGFGIKEGDLVGAGYGAGLYAVAIYETKDNVIHASWAPATPGATVGHYDLKGRPNYTGAYKFADGTRGSVTMTPGKGGAYRMVWELPSGHFEGVGVRVGNALVAVSGKPGAPLGVAGYRPDGVNLEGVWTMAGMTGTGRETWLKDGGSGNGATASSGVASALSVGKNGTMIHFGGEDYELQHKNSAPGKPTAELREYLKPGEDFDGYRKMVAVRLMASNRGDATELARGTLEQVKKSYPDSYTREISMEPDHAVIVFIVLAGKDAEMNVWDFRQTKAGFPCAQFVLRNKPPFETQEKFKAEQDAHFDQWRAELAQLSTQAETVLAATAGNGNGEVAAKKPSAKENLPPELAEAIGADLKKCGAIGQQFIGFIKAGDTKKAVGLMSDNAFKQGSRAEFLSSLDKSLHDLGPLKDFVVDKDATDFGVVDKDMTFTFQGDAQYEKANMRETLRFIRNRAGEIEFVSYTRKQK